MFLGFIFLGFFMVYNFKFKQLPIILYNKLNQKTKFKMNSKPNISLKNQIFHFWGFVFLKP